MNEESDHITLVCWDYHHKQLITKINLKDQIIAPMCTAKTDKGLCASPIWAVEHKDEPTRYVGRPPHRNWQSWAECIPRRS